MKNPNPFRHRSSVFSPQPSVVAKPVLRHRCSVFRDLFLAACMFVAIQLVTFSTLKAQTPLPVPDPSSALSPPSSVPVQTGPLTEVFDGLLGKYGWLTTVLLAIGSLRILFKPVMLVVENTVKNDPSKFAEVQKFEAGPIYKAIATVLDVGASIKLPLVKPPGPPNP